VTETTGPATRGAREISARSIYRTHRTRCRTKEGGMKSHHRSPLEGIDEELGRHLSEDFGSSCFVKSTTIREFIPLNPEARRARGSIRAPSACTHTTLWPPPGRRLGHDEANRPPLPPCFRFSGFCDK
jgi:hypothetical protein